MMIAIIYGILYSLVIYFILFHPFIMSFRRWRKKRRIIGGIYITLGIVTLFYGAISFTRNAATSMTFKAEQGEAKATLGSIRAEQLSYYKEHGNFAKSFEELNWYPKNGSKYEYFLNDKKSIEGIDKKNIKIEGIDINLLLNEGYFAVARGKSEPIDIWLLDHNSRLINLPRGQKNIKNFFRFYLPFYFFLLFYIIEPIYQKG